MFGRLRTKDGHFISSYWIKRNDDISRNNYCVNVSKNKYLFILYLYFIYN